MLSTLTTLALISVVGIFCQWVAWRARLPAILFLLIAGILAGPVGDIVNPDELFGDMLFPFISLSVAIILFEGSLTLKFSELKEIGSVVRNMVTYGALINASITTVAVHYLTGITWPLSALFGAIMVVTGPTVIVPLLRTVKPNARVSNVLRWEGIVIDPLGALFAVVVFEWIVAQQAGSGWGHISMTFLKTIASGMFIGAIVGHLFGLVLRNHWLPEYLHNFAALAVVCGGFAAAEEMHHEAGLLAVTVMGMWLANMKDVNTAEILNFKESLTVVLVSSLFIVMAARIDFGAFKILGWGGVGVLLVIQLFSRPIKVFFSTLGSVFTPQECLLMAWVGPRGIVAAAVTALFALKLENLGFYQANLLVPLAFMVIMGTVVIQSATAKPLAKLLGVAEPDSRGFLIVGGNPVARAIAGALQSAGYRVLLSDTYWDNISAARMDNLPTYYGSLLSEHADTHLDLVGLGGMLGLSHHADRNNLAVLKYRNEFGPNNVYCLATRADNTAASSKHIVSDRHRGDILFGVDMTYSKLAGLIAKGAQIKSTTLTEEFNFQSWLEHESNFYNVPLFVLDNKENLSWFTDDADLNPKNGWQLYSLVPNQGDGELTS